MQNKTIFLSYAHTNEIIADGIDMALVKKNYIVKRDIRDAATWESLRAFMKTIRKEDYAVLLVSDTYLHRKNCLYELMQLLKDDEYINRVFPIAINFSSVEKSQRLANGMATSMFDVQYFVEIVLFWQNEADALKKMVSQIDAENRAELDEIYREVKNMAQTASEFLSSTFQDKLLKTINTDNPDYNDVANAIDYAITRIKP